MLKKILRKRKKLYLCTKIKLWILTEFSNAKSTTDC